jgi:hypothetical protein
MLPQTADPPPDEERIGPYRVHPVAAMFPLMEGEDFESLKDSIEVCGQVKAIVVQGDVLLDGRNRLRACLALGIRAKTMQYDGKISIPNYIRIANIERRNLTEDMRSAICYQIFEWDAAQKSLARQKAAGAAQGHRGIEGGRGHKKPLTLNSASGVSEPKTRARDARSTAGQLAQKANVSRYKAEQTIAVGKAVPDLLEQVKRGEVKLKDAYAQVRAAAPERKPREFNPQKRATIQVPCTAEGFLRAARKHLSLDEQRELGKALLAVV